MAELYAEVCAMDTMSGNDNPLEDLKWSWRQIVSAIYKPEADRGVPSRAAKVLAIIGVAGILLPWGASLIGVTVNIYFGSLLLLCAFVLLVWAFWIWEKPLRFNVAVRILTIVVAALGYFGMVGKQVVAEWKIEHPNGGKIPPACYIFPMTQVTQGQLVLGIANQTTVPIDDVDVDVATMYSDDINKPPASVEWADHVAGYTCKALLTTQFSIPNREIRVDKWPRYSFSFFMTTRANGSFRETLDLVRQNDGTYSTSTKFYKGAEITPLYSQQATLNSIVFGAVVSQPKFVPKLDGVFGGPAGDPHNSIIGVMGTIDNLGAPSSIDNFGLTVTMHDGRIIPVTIPRQPANKDVIVGKNKQGKNMMLSGRTYWPNQRSARIEQNGHLDGWIIGLVQGAGRDEIKKDNATVTLTCTDVNGNESHGETPISWKGMTDARDIISTDDLQKPMTSKRGVPVSSSPSQEVRVSRLLVTSDNPSMGKHAEQFTVTTNQAMVGGRAVITCDNPINIGHSTLGNSSVVGHAGDDGMLSGNSYQADISVPDWSPNRPLIITLYFDENDLGKCNIRPLS
jgi:hypothetical protein